MSWPNQPRHPRNHEDRSNSVIVPLSLGKPSLRRRLEAYYRLVAPSQIETTAEWLPKLDQIYEKYGGSHQGEENLARKLAKKYGTAVSLETVPPPTTTATTRPEPDHDHQYRDEHWYQEQPGTLQASGCLDMVSPNMDARALLLNSDQETVERDNAWLATHKATLLERVDLFANYLPRCDPLSAKARPRRSYSHKPSSLPTSANDTHSSSRKDKIFNVPRCFAEISQAVTDESNIAYACRRPQENDNENLEIGPMSLLARAMQERFPVRLLIRYGKRGLRGTLTGFVVAMDKHWNLILQDVQEVYSPPSALNVRGSSTNKEAEEEADENDAEQNDDGEPDNRSTLERELQRRQHCRNGQLPHKRRSLPQLLVRGDNIVLCYRVTAEESALVNPQLQTHYRKRSVRQRNEQDCVGTPGTCICSVHDPTTMTRGKKGQ